MSVCGRVVAFICERQMVHSLGVVSASMTVGFTRHVFKLQHEFSLAEEVHVA